MLLFVAVDGLGTLKLLLIEDELGAVCKDEESVDDVDIRS
jgi:hypothetical protein